MAEASKKHFITSLQNTHAAEEKIAQVLKQQINQANDFPDIKQKLEQHLDETKVHAQVVEDCLKSLDSDISTLKETAASLFGTMEGFSNLMEKDSVLKNSIMAYTTEHFEIATYKALITEANLLEETTIAEKLEKILAEEIQMAQWLDKNLQKTAEKSLELITEE